MKIIFQYSPWLIPLCVLVGALYAFVLYRKDRRLTEFPTSLIYILAFLRFLSVSTLAILLLSPLVKYINRQVSEPIFLIAQDNSASMISTVDSTKVRADLPEWIDGLSTALNSDFELQHYYFGESLRRKESPPNYSDRFSNFEDLFKELNYRYENRNVGAMLMITDGIFNRGMNPLYTFEGLDFPVYVLAVGDTNSRRDLILSNIVSNKIAFLGNQFPVKVEYKAIKAKGSSTEIQLKYKGEIIQSKKVEINKDLGYGEVDFLIEAKESGLQSYQVAIAPINKENTKANNFQNFYVDILDSRQKILFLYGSPHPDIAALQTAVSSSENYKVDLIQLKDFKKELKSYDLVIMHGIINSNLPQGREIIKKSRNADLPILFILDRSTDWNYLSALNTPIIASRALQSYNEVYPLYEEAFPLFNLGKDQLTALTAYPPLQVPQANYSLNKESYVLLRQQIGSVPTKSPLLAFNQTENRKEGTLVGEGYWRWRIANYSKYGDHKNFDRFVSKIIQYLSVKSDKSYFRLSNEKEIMENEKLRFDLQLFNKAYDPINEPDAYLELFDEEGNQFDYQFNRTANAYFIELSGLDVGTYSFRAYTSFDKQLLEERGKLTVREIFIENVQLVADHNLLYQIAQKSGGAMIYDFDLENFVNEIQNREDISSLSYTTEDVEDVINLQWIFFVLLSLLSLEWFIRKYQGAY